MTEQLSGRLVDILANSKESKKLHARALLLRGRVLSETKKATPLQIADTYFKPVSTRISIARLHIRVFKDGIRSEL